MLVSSYSFFTLSPLFILTTALPFFPLKALILDPRATYSVVPVDGGSPATEQPTTVIETIIQTLAPATKTIIETDTPAPTTDYIVSIATVLAAGTTETDFVTLTPQISTSVSTSTTTTTESATTVTTTGYSVINVGSSVTVESTVISTFFGTPTRSFSFSSVIPIFSGTPTRSFSFSSITSTPSSDTLPTLTSGSSMNVGATSFPDTTATSFSSMSIIILSPTVPSSTSVSASSSTTYDDGMWHTTYPSWYNYTKTQEAAYPSPTTSLV